MLDSTFLVVSPLCFLASLRCFFDVFYICFGASSRMQITVYIDALSYTWNRNPCLNGGILQCHANQREGLYCIRACQIDKTSCEMSMSCMHGSISSNGTCSGSELVAINALDLRTTDLGAKMLHRPTDLCPWLAMHRSGSTGCP